MPKIKWILLFFVAFFLQINFLFSQSKDKLIPWSSNHRLTAANFEKPAPDVRTEHNLGHGKRSILEGFIFTGIDFGFQRINNDITYTVQSFMEPEKSWMNDTSNIQTLEHEQAHFDITEIYSRMMKRELSTTKNNTVAKQVYQNYFHDLQLEQNKFDVAHHGETGVEPEWQKKITEQLEELEKWENNTVKVKLK